MPRAGRVARAIVAAGVLSLFAACDRQSPATPAPIDAPQIYCNPQLGGSALCVAADAQPAIPSTPLVAPEKKRWEAKHGGEEGARRAIKARLADWPQRLLGETESLPRDGRQFLRRVAADTWRGLSAFVDRDHGLPIDHVYFDGRSVDGNTAQIGDYVSSSDLGWYLMAIVAARELEFLAPEDALARARFLIDTARQLQDHAGFLFNYYDTTSLERTSNFISFVDSAWCTAGLMVARVAFPELAPILTPLIEQRDYGFFYDEGLRRMSHGYDAAAGVRSRFHYGMLFTEARIGSLIAIGKGDVPAVHWQAMAYDMPEACGITAAWSDCAADNAELPVRGGLWQWQGVRFVRSWGGSMFEALMPMLVVDERTVSPLGLGANDAAHVAVQRLYADEYRQYPVWGMSPSMDPRTGKYGEFGVPLLGAHGYSDAVVSPHASALALAVDAEAAIANLRQLAERYPIYGEYGFYDAVDPHSGEVSYSYLTLDQTMILIAIANHLQDHVIQRMFTSDPIIARVLPLLAGEEYFAH